MHWLGTSVAIFASTLIPLQKDIHMYTQMIVDFSVVLITEKGQDSTYCISCCLTQCDLFFSSFPFGRDRQHFNWLLKKNKKSACKRQREEGRKVIHYDGLTAKVALVISSHFWAPGPWAWGWIVLCFKFGVATWPDDGWSTPTCWQSSFLSKVWKKKPKKQNLALI